MALSHICGSCTRMDKTASAVKYCTDCEDPLCVDCVNSHKAVKVLALHHLIDEENRAWKACVIKKTLQ